MRARTHTHNFNYMVLCASQCFPIRLHLNSLFKIYNWQREDSGSAFQPSFLCCTVIDHILNQLYPPCCANKLKPLIRWPYFTALQGHSGPIAVCLYPVKMFNWASAAIVNHPQYLSLSVSLSVSLSPSSFCFCFPPTALWSVCLLNIELKNYGTISSSLSYFHDSASLPFLPPSQGQKVKGFMLRATSCTFHQNSQSALSIWTVFCIEWNNLNSHFIIIQMCCSSTYSGFQNLQDMEML